MRIKLIIAVLALPLLAFGQVTIVAPPNPISIGDGIRLTAPEFDADAAAYFIRAGVTDFSAKQKISSFVSGLKLQGLWGNSVCWPLIASQNAGTGSVIYSLGGLGVYSGTSTNGPTWGSEGMTFASASAQYVLTGLKLSTGSNYTVIGVAKYTNAAINFPCAVSAGASAAAQLYARGNGSTAIYGDAWSFAGAGSAGQNDSTFSTLNRYMSLVAADSSSVAFWWNDLQYGLVAGDYRVGAGNTGRVTIGAANTNDPGSSTLFRYNGTVSFAMICTVKLDAAQRTALYNLYKATLGQGLGLP